VLPLNYAIMTVVLLATVESATWFGAYEQLNGSGEPYCCPFPSVVIAALVLQVDRWPDGLLLGYHYLTLIRHSFSIFEIFVSEVVV